MVKRTGWWVCVALMSGASGAMGQSAVSQSTSQPSETTQAGPASWADRATLTDDWFGLGRRLSDRGLTTAVGLTQVCQQNLHGGTSTHRHAGRYAGRYDVELDADLEKLATLRGGRVYALGRGGWSDGLDESSVESLFGANTVANGDRSLDVWQLYYEQAFCDRQAFVRVGKVDLTGGFECRGCPGSFDGNSYANDETSQFLNGSLTNNPTIPFPDPGLGAIVHVEPTEWWYLSAAAADAQADLRETGLNTTFHGRDDFFSVYETGLLPRIRSARGPLQGAYRVGFWYDPQPKERFDGNGFKRDDLGVYTSFDQAVWKENADAEDTQGLGLFGRFGAADGDVNEVRRFWSTGVQYQGLVRGRDNDVAGFGVGQGLLSRPADFPRTHETALEWYYNIELAPWLHISPNVQYLFNPGGGPAKDAVLVGVRVQMAI